MAIQSFLTAVSAGLSHEAKVLVDTSSEEFILALERWSDLEKKNPGAIILVAGEEDVVTTVKLAIEYDVPFVPKSGGHSRWSTIGEEGIIIDLSNFKNIIIDKENKTVKVQGGILNKQLIEELYDAGLVVPLGGANTIGSIPLALGGGVVGLNQIAGTTSDNIISARIITAAGKQEIVNKDTNPDLLWALKGAGQHFGLVTELELQAYPLSILNSDDGTVWRCTYIFDISKTAELAKVSATLMGHEGDDYALALAVMTVNPMSGEPCMLFLTWYFGSTESAESFWSPIQAVGPVAAMPLRTPYSKVNDAADSFCVKGDFKRFYLSGVKEFDPEPWGEIADIWVNLMKERKDVTNGGFGWEWNTGKPKMTFKDSAWAHRGLTTWLENLAWYSDPESAEAVDAALAKAIDLETKHVPKEEIQTYQNFSRDTSLESRFGSSERVERLKALKKKWDPKGLFTKEFL